LPKEKDAAKEIEKIFNEMGFEKHVSNHVSNEKALSGIPLLSA
jgi:hypothetical protein